MSSSEEDVVAAESEMPSAEDLREAYEQLRRLEDQEKALSEQLRVIKTEKSTLKLNFIRFMEMTETAKLQIRGSPNALELVESKRSETLTREAIKKRILDFFKEAAFGETYRSASPREQCEMLLTSIFENRQVFASKRLKLVTDKRHRKLQEEIERSIPTTSSLASSAGAGQTSNSPRNSTSGKKTIIRRK
jgi:hypothetical protein